MTGDVLVIGGLGYVGAAVCDHLRGAGRHVVSCDLGWFGGLGASSNRPIDYRCLEPGYVRGFEAVVLLAGHSSVPMSQRSGPAATFRSNVANLVDLVGWLRAGQRLLYASSASVYSGLAGECRECNALLPPVTCYDLSKSMIDQYVSVAAPAGVRWYGLRFGTVNGGSPHLRVDVMMNQMYASARERGEVAASNPDVWRPILGTADLCGAVAHLLAGDAEPGIYNVSSLNAQVRKLAKAVADHVGVPVRWGPSTPSYDMRMDVEKLRRAGFAPAQDIASILRSLDEHYDVAHRTARSEGVSYAA